ncbi:MAG: hypothetical protein Q8O34_07140 [Rhodocyclaceae bacterium]|nr:hypothetical protein [Rhodocyclaceae bacterium]
MRNSLIAIILAVSPSIALAQMSIDVQRSSSPRGVQIQGDTDIKARGQNVNTVAAGKDNTAKTAVGAVKGGTQIQGHTEIKASAKNVSTVAVGKDNKAGSTVGAIGGGQ